jgi:hypothetical protein
MIAGIARRGASAPEELAIDPAVRQLCSELERRLDEAGMAAAVR